MVLQWPQLNLKAILLAYVFSRGLISQDLNNPKAAWLLSSLSLTKWNNSFYEIIHFSNMYITTFYIYAVYLV